MEKESDDIVCYELKPGDGGVNTTSQYISVMPSVSNFGTGGEGLELDTPKKRPRDSMQGIIKEDQSNDCNSEE